MRIKELADNLARECMSDLIASDLMTQPPISLCACATIPEALHLFLERGFHAAPVIDDVGYPIGVVSMADILRHDLDRGAHPSHVDFTSPDSFLPEGFGVEEVDHARVEDIMTHAVFTISADTRLPSILQQMLELDVHQLYVVDRNDLLVGVVSSKDILTVLGKILS